MAYNAIEKRKNEYAFKITRLQLEKARAEVAKIVIETVPLGARGKLIVQTGGTVITGSAIGTAVTQYFSTGTSWYWLTIPFCIIVCGLAFIWAGFKEIGVREKAQQDKFNDLMGKMGIV